jgi:parallel beta-helix repeat protein
VGEVSVPLGSSIQSVIDGSPQGSTFRFAAGTYRNQSILTRSGDAYLGASDGGTVLSGARVLTNWRQSGLFWSCRGLPPQQIDHGVVGINPLANRDNDLFRDGALVTRVAGAAQLAPGTWYYDVSNNSVVVYDNPIGHLMEYSVTPNLTYDNEATGVTWQNITVEKYSTAAQTGAIHGVRRWTISGSTFQWCHGVGLNVGAGTVVSACRCVHNGQAGIEGYLCDGARIADTELAYNNYAGYATDWDCGGLKIATAAGVMISRCNVHDNMGPGIWADIDSSGWLIEGCKITNNVPFGIEYEISHRGSIVGNTVSGSPQFGIYIQNSDGMSVAGNTVTVRPGNAQPYGGIAAVNAARGSGPEGVYQCVSNMVTDNTIWHVGDTAADGIYVYQGLPADAGNVWDSNTYLVPNGTTPFWHFGATDYLWDALRQQTPYEDRGSAYARLA